jgi:hypothetical protein
MRWFTLLGTLLFFGAVIPPGVVAEDITPPVTTLILDPAAPTGLNGWYVSDIEISFIAEDNESGVNSTYYRINNETWLIYSEAFSLDVDGYYFIEYYSTDIAGNIEAISNLVLKIDGTYPIIDLVWESGPGNDIILTAYCADETSGIDYVEFYMDDMLRGIDDSEPYECIIILNESMIKEWFVNGFIFLKESTASTVSLFAFIVVIQGWVGTFDLSAIAFDVAGNQWEDTIPSPGIRGFPVEVIVFQPITVLNDFTGRISRFMINARFDHYPII